MTELQMTETEIPANVSTGGHAKEPNPFTGKFPTTEGKALSILLPSRTDAEKKYVEKVKGQAQTAARETVTDDAPNGYTARVVLTPAKVKVKEGGKSVEVDGTSLTIWSIDRITRTRKPSEESTPEATPES